MHDFVARNARRIPDRPALVWQGSAMSWRALDERVSRLGNALIARGIAPGERVVTLLENGPELVECIFALSRIGAVWVPMLARSVAREIVHVVDDVGARGLVLGPESGAAAAEAASRLATIDLLLGVHEFHGGAREYEKLVHDAAAENPAIAVDPDAVSVIRYTSGTTGAPKGAMRSPRQVATATLIYLAHAPQRDRDRLAIASPLSVGLGNALLPGAFCVGATAYVLPKFDATALLETIARERITLGYAIMASFDELTRHPDLERFDLASLRHFTGSSATQDTLRGLKRLRAHPSFRGEFFNAYGSTEAGGYIAVHAPEDFEAELADPALAPRAESIGREAMLCRVECVDENLRPLPPGEPGELAVRAPTVTLGYWNRPEETREILREGWLVTGDMAWRDADGFLYLAGRKRDMIKSGGLNVYPAEVEFVLAAHPRIAEVAVIGVRDARWGEKVVACVVARGRCTADDVVDFCAGKLAGYKRPKEVVFLDSLPKNETGKVVKKILRESLIPAKP